MLMKEQKATARQNRQDWTQLLGLRAGREILVQGTYAEWLTAQKRAHDISARKGWKIETEWDGKKQDGTIRRLK